MEKHFFAEAGNVRRARQISEVGFTSFREFFGWNSDRRSAVWVLPLTGVNALKPQPAVKGPFYGLGVRFSPDGKFLAYRSDETDRNEIYVETFDGGGGKEETPGQRGRWLISKGSLGMARWREDSKELYYLSLDGEVMTVPITTTPVFHAGEPTPLFHAPANFLGRGLNTPGSSADVTGDGKRFIFAMPVADVRRDEITVVTNWQTGLKK